MTIALERPSLAQAMPRAARPLATARSAPALVRLTLFLFVLSIFFEIPHRTIPLEVDSATGLLFLLSTLIAPATCYRRVPSALVWFAGYLWLLALAILVNGSDNIFVAVKDGVSLVLLCVLFWAVFNLLTDPRVLGDVLLAVALGAVLRASMQVAGIGATTYTVWTGGDRVTMFGQNANLSAMILSAGLATIVGLQVVRQPGLPRFGLLTWPMAAVVGLATIQTGSRGGLLSAGIALGVYWFRGHSMWLRLRNGLVGVAAVAGLGIGAMATTMMRNRLEQSAEEGKMAGRELIYPAAIEMFLEKPLLGWGSPENQVQVARRIGDRLHASRDVHNIVLELLTTAGVPGAICGLMGLGLCVRGGWRARHGPLGALPFGVLTAVLVGCISGTWIESKILWFVLALALGSGTHWSRPADLESVA